MGYSQDQNKDMEKVLEVIGLILSIHGGKIYSKTKLIKLLYLLDLQFAKESGIPLTGIEYKSYFYGPYSEDIEDALKSLEKLGFLEVTQEKSTFTGKLYYVLKLLDLPRFNKLTEKEKEKIRKLVSRYIDSSLDDILDEVYETEEYKNTPFGEVIHIGAPFHSSQK